jgi:hypothetical protein
MGARDKEQARTSNDKQEEREYSSLNFEWARSRRGRREKDITGAPLVPAGSKNRE